LFNYKGYAIAAMTRPANPINPGPIEKHIGKRLRQAREAKGLSAAELELLIGRMPGTVAAIEAGRSFIAVSQLYEMSCLLHVDMSFFFEGMPKAAAAAPMPTATDAETVLNAVRLVRAYYDIDEPELRKEVIELVKSVAKDETLAGVLGPDE